MAASSSLANAYPGFVGAFWRVVAHWRAFIVLLVFACAVPLALHRHFFVLILFALLLIFIASQIYWIGRILDLGERVIPRKPRRAWLAIIAVLLYLFVFIYNYPEWGLGHHIRASDYRLQSVFFAAVFWWWFVGSMLAFLVVIAFGAADRAARAAGWVYTKACETRQGHGAAPNSGVIVPDPPSPARRRFLEQTAVLAGATPFVAVGYGLLYERLDVEVVRQRIRLARLPNAFQGFRIAQLSDIHLGPFATASYILRCVGITNGLKPDLIALTGDYICWDPAAQGDAVRALAGLRAPYGVFGCLGNHEGETEIEASITRLFATQAIRILRQERAPIQLGGETLNLIGIDCPPGDSEEEWRASVNQRMQQIKGLMMPDTVNILLSHYSYMFEDIADLGVDLTLAGDLHGGGQMSLDFIHRGLNLGTLIGAHYVRGWYEKRGAQLYANRGIGVTGPPIRLGARPEITLLELVRA